MHVIIIQVEYIKYNLKTLLRLQRVLLEKLSECKIGLYNILRHLYDEIADFSSS